MSGSPRGRAESFLSRAATVCSSFPDGEAVRSVILLALPAAADLGVSGARLHAALRYVRDEAEAVQAGLSIEVDVLADEIASARRLLPPH